MKKTRQEFSKRVASRLFRSLLPTLIGAFSCAGLYAQTDTQINGTVRDPQGNLIPGVVIQIQGTAIGTVSGTNGSYRLDVPAGSTVVFSSLGYHNVEVSGSQLVAQPDMVLANEVLEMDEVVVVGYGAQKKATLTGSVSSVKGTDLVSTKNESLTNMLAGKMAGVRVVQTTGEPGTLNSSIAIRGMGAPLVIIDGVPREGMERMDPNEIESISVLKDGAAAIYGVRASNGVILVTTRTGSKGRASIEYSTYFGTSSPINTPRGLNALEYMEITNENNIMRGSKAPGDMVFSDEAMEVYRSGKRTDTEWQRIGSNFYAPQQYHNVQVNGGSNIMDYFVNFAYFDQDGLYDSGDLNYNRFNLRSNLGAQVTKNLKVNLRLSGQLDDTDKPTVGTENFWKAAWTYTPVTPAYANYNPLYPQNVEQGYNPLVITDSDKVGNHNAKRKGLTSYADIVWDVPWVKGLQAKASYAYDYTLREYKTLTKAYTLYDYNLNTDTYVPTVYGPFSGTENSYIRRDSRFQANTLMQFALSYNNTFRDAHNVSALVLYEEEVRSMDNYYASGDIEITSLEELTAASSASGGQNDAMSGDNGLWKMANKALIGKFNYDYKGRYLAEFSFRYDGSSKYTPYIRGAQWGFFPYAAIGWRISEEPFMKNSGSLSFIDNLKLRASAGQTGNDGTATFQFLEGYTYPGGFMNWPYYFDGLPRETMDLKPTVNNALTWEVMTMYDVGIDVDMWRGRLGVEFDLFRRDRSGIPATRTGTIPDWLGQNIAQENLNSQYHQGFDVTVRHRNRIGSSFTYGVTANLSYSRTKDKVVTRTQDDNQYSNWRNNTNNRYTDIWWGVDSPGQFSSLEQIWGHAIYTGPSKTGNAALKPGDYIYEDWNEDGVIDDKDTHPLRKGRLSTTNGIPMLIYGMTLEAQFKGFDFTMVFQGGAFSSIMYNYTLQAPFISDQNGPDFFYDRWHMADPKADPLDPRTKWISGFLPTTSQGSEAMNMNAKTSDSSLHRSDYLRCKSLEIGYSLPSAITNWIGIKGVRVYFSAYNLFTITSLAYLDPEHPNSTFGLLYPLTRTINFGANIKF